MRPLALLLLLACSATPRPAEEPPTASEAGAGVGPARDLTREALAALRRGDHDALLSRVDASLVALGPRATDVHTTRTDALLALREALPPGRKRRVTTRAFEVVAARGGRSAVAAGEVDVEGVKHGVLAVLVSVDGIWSIAVLQLSRAPRRAGALAPLHAPEPPPAVAQRFARALASTEELSRQLAARRGVTAVLPGHVLRGEKAIRRHLARSALRTSLRGRPRGAGTADGALTWVAAEVDVAHGSSPPLPHRALFVYEGDALVALHLASP